MTDERLPEEIEHAIDQVRYCGGQEWSIHNLRRAILAGMLEAKAQIWIEAAKVCHAVAAVKSDRVDTREIWTRAAGSSFGDEFQARAKAIREGR